MEQLKVIDRREVLEQDFKVYGTKEAPLFLARDVAEWLEHNKPSELTAVLDDDEKLMAIVSHSGQRRNMWFLTEDGLYEVLMQSRKPIAKQFKREVKKILKELRINGSYELTKDPLELMKLSMKALEQTNEDVEDLKSDVTYLKDEVKLEAGEYDYLSRQVKSRVREALNIYGYADTSEVKKSLFKDISQGVNEVCGVRTRTQMKQKHFDRAMEYVNAWVPSTATRMKVKQLTMNFNEGESNA